MTNQDFAIISLHHGFPTLKDSHNSMFCAKSEETFTLALLNMCASNTSKMSQPYIKCSPINPS